MGELGGRPDTPPEEPDKPAKAPDRARTPDPPSDSNKDPRAVWRTIRASDHPAFADPRVEVRYVTDRNPNLSPGRVRPYETSKDRPEPRIELERRDEPVARTLDVERPRADNPFAGDTVDRSKFNEGRKRIWEHVDDACDAFEGMGRELDKMLGRQHPTGQHTQDGPRESIADHISPPHGIDAGGMAAAMFATGLLVGEGARLAYRKMSELRERRNAGPGNR